MALAIQDELAALRVRVAELEARLCPGENVTAPSRVEADCPTENVVACDALLREIISSLPEMLVVVDYDWRVLYMNPEVERRRGFETGEALGRNFWESWPDFQSGKELLWGAMESRVPVRFEYPVSIDVWMETRAFPCESGLVLHSRDITERRKTELTKEEMAAIITSSYDAIIGEDLAGIIRSWNAGAERIFGYSAEETIGKSISMLAVPGGEDEIPELLNRLKRGERIDHYRTKRRTKDGRIVAVSLTLSPIKNAAGEIVGASKVARDITESEKAERSLLAANEALRRANEDLEQFSYAAAHDLQEPLRMVAIYSEMLKRDYAGKLDERAEEYIKYCVEGAVKMQVLVRDLLAFSKATSLYDERRPATNLNSVLEKVRGNLQAAVAESGASIIHEELPEVRAHETLMQHLFQNLISNAIKYRNEQAAPVIKLEAVRQEDGWLFSVSDNGIGIKAEYRQRVFGLFKRLHSSSKYPGTGLGLAICQRIVERYGGKIWVDSEFGAGSTFYFTLPDPQWADVAVETPVFDAETAWHNELKPGFWNRARRYRVEQHV